MSAAREKDGIETVPGSRLDHHYDRVSTELDEKVNEAVGGFHDLNGPWTAAPDRQKPVAG